MVAVSGDVVEIRDKNVFINGKLQQHPFGYHTDPVIIPGGNQPRDNFGPITVSPDSLFVLGDNRDHSYDSRFWGYVNLRAVKGKAFIIYWSWNKEDFGVRWTRLGKLLK